MTNTELQAKKSRYGKALKRRRKELKKAKNYFSGEKLPITLITSIEENKTSYTFESVLRYVDALGLELELREKGKFDKDGNPMVTKEEFHTCDGLLKLKEKGE